MLSAEGRMINISINKDKFVYPDFNGNFIAELVDKEFSNNGKILTCYFDCHIKGGEYKFKLPLKRCFNKTFMLPGCNADFATVCTGTNWKCCFKANHKKVIWTLAFPKIIVDD